MIQFDEELKKFKPCLEIEDAEEAIYSYETKDVIDILSDMMKEIHDDK